MILFTALYIFFDFLYYLIIADVILSWLTLAGINLRPKFISQILDPMYKGVKTYIPTNFGMFDFTPIIVIFITIFFKGLILVSFPEVQLQLSHLIR